MHPDATVMSAIQWSVDSHCLSARRVSFRERWKIPPPRRARPRRAELPRRPTNCRPSGRSVAGHKRERCTHTAGRSRLPQRHAVEERHASDAPHSAHKPVRCEQTARHTQKKPGPEPHSSSRSVSPPPPRFQDSIDSSPSPFSLSFPISPVAPGQMAHSCDFADCIDWARLLGSLVLFKEINRT
jgi:hypothetical protein